MVRYAGSEHHRRDSGLQEPALVPYPAVEEFGKVVAAVVTEGDVELQSGIGAVEREAVAPASEGDKIFRLPRVGRLKGRADQLHVDHHAYGIFNGIARQELPRAGETGPVAVEGHEYQPDVAPAELRQAAGHAKQCGHPRGVRVRAGIAHPVEAAHAVEVRAHDYVAAEPARRHAYHVVARLPGSLEGLEGSAQSGVPELAEDIEGARAGAGGTEAPALPRGIRKKAHLRHEFIGSLGPGTRGRHAANAQKEENFADLLQFGMIIVISLQR